MLPENPRKKNKNRISGDIKRDATGISFLLEKDGEAVEEKKISVSLHENESYIRKRCENCDDILIRPMRLGEGHKVDCLMVYIEVAVSNMMLDDSAIGKMINHFWEIPEEKIREFIRRNSLGIADVEELFSMEEVFGAVLSGNAVFFMDGYDRAMKISSKGYPGLDVSEAETEKVLRGSKEGFCDSVKTNAALVRKRIRDTRLKVEQQNIGVRSNTVVQLLYVEDLVHEELLIAVKERLESFTVDGILDSGMLEQLTEEAWYSPFPQFQTTERPDRAAMSILEGRVILLVDNSPVALILPTDYNSFIRTSDDYYNRFEIASFGRMLRYVASFFAMTLPGLYLAVTNFHTQILPTTLLLSFADARRGVPFPAVIEVLIMEISFELLREAGVRLPGAMGNTIGIVGGLIIGQAAVEANLVSPIVVIVISFTALCSFAIPNEEFATAFRVLKFFFIALCAWLGFFGMLAGLLAVLIHLSHLKSFGIPYLMPFVGADLNDYEDERDALYRQPLRKLLWRPVYAKRKKRRKLRWKS